MSFITELVSMSDHDKLIAARKDKLVVLDAHATWCGPCHAIAPKFETMSKTYREATFAKFDVDKAQQIAQHYSIRASQYSNHNSVFRYLYSFLYKNATLSTLPTFILVKNGQKVEEIKGADPSRLEAAIRRHTSSSSSTSPVFPGQGRSLSSRDAATPATQPGSSGFGYLKVVVIVALIYAWVTYARKVDHHEAAEVLGL